MSERTTEEIATVFTNAGDSVTVINTLAADRDGRSTSTSKARRRLARLRAANRLMKEL